MATLSIAAVPHPELTQPAVRVTVTDTGTPAVLSVTVLRVNPDGTTTPVRTFTDGASQFSGGTLTVWDYEAPFGRPVKYQAGSATTAAVTLDVQQARLVHPTKSRLSCKIELLKGSNDDETLGIDRGVYQVLQRSTPITVVGGDRYSPVSELLVGTDTAADTIALRSLLRDGSTLLLNVPPSIGMGIETAYISVGDVTRHRVSDIGSSELRAFTLPFMVVDRPAGGLQGPVTYADLAAIYPTYSAVPAGTTYAQLAEPS